MSGEVMKGNQAIGVDIEEAYQYCQELTEKRESNFAIGFSLLPRDRFRAIHVVYAFCRFVDDISDETEEKNAESLLNQWRTELAAIYSSGECRHPISIALKDVLKKYPVPREGFEELIQGCIQDQQKKSYQTVDDLLEYCDFVATSISKVSLPVYGYKKDVALIKVGRDLSLAFQLTNILRDISEDYHRGRIYTPQNELDLVNLSIADVVEGKDLDAIRRLYKIQGDRCDRYFQSGYKVLEYLHVDSRACVKAMWEAYHYLLEKIMKDPIASLRKKVTLSESDKKAILGN